MLFGLDGNDTLNGGGGIDSMTGGLGDDVYIVDDAGDFVFEFGGEGTDTIRTSLTTYNLVGLPQIENLEYTGTGAANLTGNAANNVLAGARGNDTLDGGDGIDTLRGGSGNDRLMLQHDLVTGGTVFDGGSGSDTLYVSNPTVTNTPDGPIYISNLFNASISSIEAVSFGSTASTVFQARVDFNQLGTGFAKNLTLNGGAGVDKFLVLAGGSGNYQLPSFTLSGGWNTTSNAATSDAVLLVGVNGNDYTLRAAATHTGLQVLVGADMGDFLIGGRNNEALFGGDGDDTMEAGEGNDTMTGGEGSDVFVIDGDGVKVITDFVIGTDKIDLYRTGIDNFTNLAPILSESGGNTVLTSKYNGVTTTYTIQGVTGLTATDFLFSTDTDNKVDRGSGNADLLAGAGGNDDLKGLGGADTLFGLNGNDTLDGGQGNDLLVGGLGNDTYVIDSVGDVVVENAASGIDTITSTLSTYTLANLANIENLTYIGSSASTLTGNAANNSLAGGSGTDTLNGLAGANTLNGNGGNDTLVQAGDVAEGSFYNGGGGTDTLAVSQSVGSAGLFAVNFAVSTLQSIERVTFGSVTNTTFQIITVAPQIGAGISFETELVGGAGADKFIIVAPTAGSYQLASFKLTNWTTTTDSATSDVVTLIAATNNPGDFILSAANKHGGIQALVGADGNDQLFGGQNNELMSGGNGNDTLDADDGNDTMTGGSGNDVFVLDGNGIKIITDFSASADRIDLSQTGFDSFASIQPYFSTVSGNAVLSASTQDGPLSYTLQGVSLGSLTESNFIFSTAANPEAKSGTSSSEVVNGKGGADRLFGLGGNDTLNGFAGNDTLDGGAGNDRVVGGAGNDVYIINSGSDTVVEKAEEGVDTIQTSLTSYGLTNLPNVENLTYTGGSNATLTGSTGANGLTGSTGNDKISGGGGNDTIRGGSGNDTLTGGAGTDYFFFDVAPNATTNLDTIKDFAAAQGEGDILRLFHSAFTALEGSVESDEFFSAAGAVAAETSLHRLIYNTTTGALYYDADGSGVSFNPIQFATLIGAPNLTFEDFSVFGVG